MKAGRGSLESSGKARISFSPSTLPPLLLCWVSSTELMITQEASFNMSSRSSPTSISKAWRTVEAGVEAISPNPRRLTEKQYQALDRLRFNIQRQHYQIDLAVALCSYLGMRPSEVASWRNVTSILAQG